MQVNWYAGKDAGKVMYNISNFQHHWATIINRPWWIFGHFWLLKVSIKYSRELCKMLFKRAFCERAPLEHVRLSRGRDGVQTEPVRTEYKETQVVLWCSVSSLQMWCWSLCLWNLTGSEAIRQGHTLCSLSICHEQILLKIRKIRFPTVWTLTSLWDMPWSSSKQLLREYMLGK